MTDHLEDMDARLQPSAERYLHVLARKANDEALQQAFYAAVLHGRNPRELSEDDLQVGLEIVEKSNQKRASNRFSLQLSSLAFAATGALAGSVALNLTTVGADSPTGAALASTVVCAAIAVCAAGVSLMLAIYEARGAVESRLYVRPGSETKRSRKARVMALWVRLEQAMFDEVWGSSDRSMPIEHPLGSVMRAYAEKHDIDYGKLNDTLKVRNAIAHRTFVPKSRIDAALAFLRDLLEEEGYSSRPHSVA